VTPGNKSPKDRCLPKASKGLSYFGEKIPALCLGNQELNFKLFPKTLINLDPKWKDEDQVKLSRQHD
jgi:hypothetical protein